MNLVSGLAVGQLLLIATWLALRHKHDLWTLIVPAVGLGIASLLRSKIGFFPEFKYVDYFVRNLLQAIVVVVVLWPLTRSPVWNWMTNGTVDRRYNFTIFDILIWTTCVAVLGMMIRQATWTDRGPVAFTQWMGLLAPGLLAVSIVLVHQLPIPWYIRLASQIAFGGFTGVLLARLANPRLTSVLITEFGMQAAVVAIGMMIAFTAPQQTSEDIPLYKDAAEQ